MYIRVSIYAIGITILTIFFSEKAFKFLQLVDISIAACYYRYIFSGYVFNSGIMAKTGSFNKHDVMISYNLESRETALKIRDILQQNGISCWIDVDVEGDSSIEGSLHDAIVAAIKNCTVFLMFYSAKYSLSQKCELEATTAEVKKKTIIPFSFEEDFDPSSMLKSIFDSNHCKPLWNFSGKYSFENKMESFIRAIKLHQNHNQARIL